jgi:hypothetical protein
VGNNGPYSLSCARLHTLKNGKHQSNLQGVMFINLYDSLPTIIKFQIYEQSVCCPIYWVLKSVYSLRFCLKISQNIMKIILNISAYHHNIFVIS